MKKIGVSKAFTIIELLIVIVVIGILATITIVGYNAVVNNTNDKAIQTELAKLADIVKLKNLDDQVVPVGGATSSGTGDQTTFPGITFKPAVSAYDTTVANLFYCEGTLNGVDEYAVVARSKSGKAYSFISNRGVAAFTGYTWLTNDGGGAICGVLGFTAPYTWSYGYYPTTSTWYSWATP